MEGRLIPINAVLALHQNRTWPAPLRDAGLRVHTLEAPLGDVNADCMSVSDEHVVLFECKSGANIEEKQAKAYSVLAMTEIARVATLTPEVRKGSPVVVYVCLEVHAERIRLGLKKAGLKMPLLVVGRERVWLEGNVPFVTSLDVDVPGLPPALVRLDAESPAAEYKDFLLSEIAAAMARGEAAMSLDALANRLPMHDVHGRRARQQMKKRAREALNELAGERGSNKLFELERKGSEHELMVRFLKAPHGKDPRGATQSWQSIQRAAAKALNSPHQARQLHLDSVWDLARDLDMEDD